MALVEIDLGPLGAQRLGTEGGRSRCLALGPRRIARKARAIHEIGPYRPSDKKPA